MKSGTLPLLGAAALGFAAAAVCFSAWSARPADAQIIPNVRPITNGGQAAVEPQPISIQALDATHFVVATREPRLVTADGKTAQNMLVTVVTHYTVRPERLVPVEHIRTPAGYQPVVTGE